jgi:PAS domain-containing protein
MPSAPESRPDLLPLFETLLGAVPVGLAFCDRDLRCLRANETLAAITGSTTAEHVGRLIGEVLPWLAEDGVSILRAAMRTGEPAIGPRIHA